MLHANQSFQNVVFHHIAPLDLSLATGSMVAKELYCHIKFFSLYICIGSKMTIIFVCITYTFWPLISDYILIFSCFRLYFDFFLFHWRKLSFFDYCFNEYFLFCKKVLLCVNWHVIEPLWLTHLFRICSHSNMLYALEPLQYFHYDKS